MCVTVPLGIKAMCYGSLFANLVALITYAHYSGKLISISALKVLSAILPSFLMSVFMGVVIYITISFFAIDTIKIVTGILIAIFVYLGTSILTKSQNLYEIKSMIRR